MLDLILVVILGLLAVFGTFKAGKRTGRKEESERISHRATVAAEKREAKRNEIDRSTNADDARNSLRNDWRD